MYERIFKPQVVSKNIISTNDFVIDHEKSENNNEVTQEIDAVKEGDKKNEKVPGLPPKSLVSDDGKLTPTAIRALAVLSGVGEKILEKVEIKHAKDNKFNAPWYNPNKGGGAVTVGNTIYFTENYFASSGYGSRKYGDTSYGKNDEFSTMVWLRLLSHEVGHLPQAESFGTDNRGIKAYLGYFALGYLIRTLTFKFPVHDQFSPEVVAELGTYVFDKLFTEVSGKAKTINERGKNFISTVITGQADEINCFLEALTSEIEIIRDEYIKENSEKFRALEKRIKKAERRKKNRTHE